MAPPLKISGEDEEVIDLQDEEVVIDLKSGTAKTTKANGDTSEEPVAAAALNGNAEVASTASDPGTAGVHQPSSPTGSSDAAQPATTGTPAQAPPAAPQAASPGAAPAADPTSGVAAAGIAPAADAKEPGKKSAKGDQVGIMEFLRTKNGKTTVVVLVATMIVAAIIIGPLGNRSPTAVITVSDQEGDLIPPMNDEVDVTDGHVIFLSGGESSDPDGNIKKYSWDFDDDKFKLVDDTTKHHKTIHGYFKCEEEPTVIVEQSITLTVKDNMGMSSSTTLVFNVAALEVHPKEEHIGDAANYTIDGKLSIINEAGLATLETKGPIGVEDNVTQIHIKYEGEHDPWIAGPRNVEDGFLREHETYCRFSTFDIRTTDQGGESYVFTENNQKYPIRDGSGAEGRLNTHIYHPDNKAVRTNLKVDRGRINVGSLLTKEFTIKGDVVAYPDANANDSVIHISDISDSFYVGKWDRDQFGEVTITWEVTDVLPQKIGEGESARWEPALKVNIQFEEIGDYEIENYEHTISYWIGEDIPYPLKSTASLQTTTEGDTIIKSDVTRKIVDWDTGTVELPDEGSAFAEEVSRAEYKRYNATEWEERSGTIRNAPMVDIDDEPNIAKGHGFYEEQGGEANGRMYQDDGVNGAIQRARTDDDGGGGPDLEDYLQEHPDAYCIWTMYNETGPESNPDLKRWNLTFGEEGSKEYYNVEVRNSRRKGSYVTDNSEHQFTTPVELSQGPGDIGETIAYASGVDRIYKLGQQYYGEILDHLFDNDGEVKFYNASAGASARTPYVPATGAQKVSPWAYYAVDQDRDVSVFVDGTNGQLMYFVVNEGDLDLLWLLQGLSG